MGWVTLWLSLAQGTSSFATAHVFRYHCKWSFLVQSLYWERKCENLSWIVYFKLDFFKAGKKSKLSIFASVWCIFSIAYECHLVFFISTLTFTFQWLEKCFLQAAASGLCTPHSSWRVRAGFAPGLGLPWRSLGLGVCRQQKPWFRPLVKLVPCWRPHRLKLEREVKLCLPTAGRVRKGRLSEAGWRVPLPGMRRRWPRAIKCHSSLCWWYITGKELKIHEGKHIERGI